MLSLLQGLGFRVIFRVRVMVMFKAMIKAMIRLWFTYLPPRNDHMKCVCIFNPRFDWTHFSMHVMFNLVCAVYCSIKKSGRENEGKILIIVSPILIVMNSSAIHKR